VDNEDNNNNFNPMEMNPNEVTDIKKDKIKEKGRYQCN
jgi:hypothetical protein